MRCPLAVEGALAFPARLCVSTRVEGSVRQAAFWERCQRIQPDEKALKGSRSFYRPASLPRHSVVHSPIVSAFWPVGL